MSIHNNTTACDRLSIEPMLDKAPNSLRVCKAIPALPEETILQILQLVADDLLEGTPAHEWWNLPSEYAAFFKSASLVCRQWNGLVQNFKTTLCVPTSEGGHFQDVTPSTQDIVAVYRLWSSAKRCLEILQSLPEYLRASSSSSGAITSLSIDLGCWGSPDLQPFFNEDKISRLRLYGSQHNDLLVWSEASYLHSNANLKVLSLHELRVELNETYAKTPCRCQTVVLEDIALSLPADFVIIFSEANRLVFKQSNDTAMIGFEGLGLTKPSDKLEHLDITCASEYSYQFGGVKEQPDILYSPNLRFFKLHILDSTNRQVQQANDPVEQRNPIIPGREMIRLVELQITVDGDLVWQYRLLRLCASLTDPTFCPALKLLPILRFKPSHDRHNLYEDAKVSIRELCSVYFRDALAALQSRGIQVRAEEIEGTVWECAKMPEVNTNQIR